MAKMGQFSPKSKAIQILPNFGPKSILQIFNADTKVVKIGQFSPKRLYTWYFAQFWPKINFTDFQCRYKSGENRPIFAQK